MLPTVKGEFSPLKKPAKKARIVIRLNRENPYTREEFVIYALESAGEEGSFVNELLRGWNDYRDKLNKPRSNYAAFRKLIWNMARKGVISRVPDYEKRDKDLRGRGRFQRSFYRLSAQFLDSLI